MGRYSLTSTGGVGGRHGMVWQTVVSIDKTDQQVLRFLLAADYLPVRVLDF